MKAESFMFFTSVTYKAAQPRELESAANYTVHSQRLATYDSQLRFYKRPYPIKQGMKSRTEKFK